jgi:hypothetical protein
MEGTATTILIKYAIEIGASSVFLIGFGIYAYIKLHWKTNEDKLVYYDITDRIIKSKKIQQRINDRVGGNKKDGTFFKAS